MLRHPVQSLFLGTVPMGFATLVNMFTAICVPAWGSKAVYVAWGMWWVDVCGSVACALGMGMEMYVHLSLPLSPMIV